MVVLVVGSVLAGRPAEASTADLVVQLDRLAASFPGGVGLWIADPAAPKPLYTRDAGEHVITASLYKLGVMAEAERRVDAHQLSYADLVTITEEDVTEDGSFEPAGTEMTLDEALEAMITISDNGAAQALWHLLGPANIDATLTKAGLADFHVALDRKEDNVATPAVIGQFFSLLAMRKLISPAASDRMLARLERQRINNRLPADLPRNVVVAHKTGNLPGITHDAGIIYTPFGPRVVVAMTWDSYEEDADAFIANIGSLVYSTALEPPANARYSVPRTAVAADTTSRPRVTVGVTNAGSNTWAASGPDAFGLIWEMRDDANALVASSASPTALPALAPGKSANVGLQLQMPLQAGTYHVTVGLVDANRRALASLGAGTGSFDVRAHDPYFIQATVAMPTYLHRGEASPVLIRFSALPTAGSKGHPLVLTWRALDTRNSRVVEQGAADVGTLVPGASGTFFVPLVAPRVIGTYRFAYELTEDGVAATDTMTTTVTIGNSRTYPDDTGGRVLAAPRSGPTPTPRGPQPFPSPSSSVVPSFGLPDLPTPKGKATPTPAAR